MKITIQNWEAYNPRKDVKTPSWFRLSHGIFEDSDFYDFTHTEIAVWIYILSQASRKNCDTIAVNLQHVERIGRFKIKDFFTAVEKLQSIQCILVDDTRTLRARDADDRSTNATNERTNDTHEHSASVPARFDFEALYSKYPRKVGKTQGIKRCETQIKTQEDYDLLSRSIDNYARQVKDSEPKFIKHFSSFMGVWRDYAEEHKPQLSAWARAMLKEKDKEDPNG